MAQGFRIATFNLENLDDRPGLVPTIEERIRVLRPQLLRLEADILCLQEVNAQEAKGEDRRRLAALGKLLAGTPYASYHLACSLAATGEGPADIHNLVTLSRFPITAHRAHWHDLVPPIDWRMLTALPPEEAAQPVRWDRPILYTAIAVKEAEGRERTLHVVNLHLRSTMAAFIPGQKVDAYTWISVPGWAEGFFLNILKRAGQALETRFLIDRLFDADESALVAVCGDFNAGARETPVRVLRAEEEDTGNGRLANRVMVPVERSIPESQRFSVLHHGEKVMLDHLLVSRALLGWYRHAEIHNEALGDELVAFATGMRSPESYHAPVVAAFEPPPEA